MHIFSQIPQSFQSGRTCFRIYNPPLTVNFHHRKLPHFQLNSKAVTYHIYAVPEVFINTLLHYSKYNIKITEVDN
jgi:hypothetical protein